MDELEIKIVLKYKVPENGLTVNGLLKGLEENKSLIEPVQYFFTSLGHHSIFRFSYVREGCPG